VLAHRVATVRSIAIFLMPALLIAVSADVRSLPQIAPVTVVRARYARTRGVSRFIVT
jgi:hypothetical protein